MALFIKRWVDVPNEPYDPKVIALKPMRRFLSLMDLCGYNNHRIN